MPIPKMRCLRRLKYDMKEHGNYQPKDKITR